MNEVKKSNSRGQCLIWRVVRAGWFGCSPSSLRARPLCDEDDQRVAQTRPAVLSPIAWLEMARALGRVTRCQNFPEVFAIQAQWVQDAADDYLSEMSKLMEVNSKIMSGMLGSLGQVGMPSAAEMPTSPAAHSAFETHVSPEARSNPRHSHRPRCAWGPRRGPSLRRVYHLQGLQRRPKTSGQGRRTVLPTRAMRPINFAKCDRAGLGRRLRASEPG